jgi:hypothetical protein
MGWIAVFENLIQIVCLLFAWALVILAFFILAIQLFVTLIEFKLSTLAGFVLIPFGLFGKTAFMAERVLGNVISSGIKVLVLAVIIGIGSTLFSQFTQGFGGQPPSVDDAMAIVLAALSLLGLGIFGPGIANGLVSGGPQLGAGAAIGTGLAVGGAALAAGGGGMLAARGGATALSGGAAAVRGGGFHCRRRILGLYAWLPGKVGRGQRCVRHGWHRACSWFCGGLSAATGGCKCQIQLRQWHSIRLRCDRRIFGQGHRRRRRRGKSIRRLTTTSASVRPCRACDPNHHPRRAFRRRPWSRIFRQPLRK